MALTYIVVPVKGWALSRYIFKKDQVLIDGQVYPLMLNEDGTEVIDKATHARFVRFIK
jgi:hypothetical protein